MIFITGGAYQGKIRYARSLGARDEDIIHGGKFCALPQHISCIAEYHLHIRRQIEAGIDPAEAARALDADIVIMDEIGCGIIPLDREERIWREQTGIVGCILAERADTVVRLVCGIPQTIKEKL
ncbi:MAG: bifunctional adenosylcobinamide kinase/adenosylcobinamide-phosphate guanylyltransferase [Oscillospiraceae bacterium]|nr:bifunctional adenosylcobinamide kinase/adenosylcobinamide-phosphate guanylyltransferase [Oscillospiraceae bacterium]